MKYISRSVWILSIISLLTDTASEMLYPVLPVYLKSIGFSIVLIGFLEGIAEATAGLSKGYFGKLSDTSGKRVPFVRFGYALSTLSKPMMAFFIHPVWIFFSRTLDRLGKGIRTGARDAMLSDEATKETKGKVFGLHRTMDTFGAAIGPAIALLYLYFYPKDYVTLFYIAFIPGLLSIAASFLLKDKPVTQPHTGKSVSFFSAFHYWKNSPAIYRKVTGGLLFFTLFNSSDIFLLLKLKAEGLDDTATIGIYIFYNLVYALFALPLGMLADKLGLKKVYLMGLLMFAAVYLGFTIHASTLFYIGLFFLYGVYSAATEGISKAWISNISAKEDTATAIGTYAGFQSIGALLASSFAGLIWMQFGSDAVFMTVGIAALCCIIYFGWVLRNELPDG